MKDLFDILLDPGNRDPLVLTDGDGRRVVFEQVAVIPYDIDGSPVLYAVLKPISGMTGIADDEAIVFKAVEGDDGRAALLTEDDERIATEVFRIYDDLLEKALRKERKRAIG